MEMVRWADVWKALSTGLGPRQPPRMSSLLFLLCSVQAPRELWVPGGNCPEARRAAVENSGFAPQENIYASTVLPPSKNILLSNLTFQGPHEAPYLPF